MWESNVGQIDNRIGYRNENPMLVETIKFLISVWESKVGRIDNHIDYKNENPMLMKKIVGPKAHHSSFDDD